MPPEHIRHGPAGPEIRDGAFKNFPNPELKRMSVVLGDSLTTTDRQPSSLAIKVGGGLARLRAGDVRAKKQRIERTPQSDEPAHGDVWGDKPGATRRALAKVAEWEIPPA